VHLHLVLLDMCQERGTPWRDLLQALAWAWMPPPRVLPPQPAAGPAAKQRLIRCVPSPMRQRSKQSWSNSLRTAGSSMHAHQSRPATRCTCGLEPEARLRPVIGPLPFSLLTCMIQTWTLSVEHKQSGMSCRTAPRRCIPTAPQVQASYMHANPAGQVQGTSHRPHLGCGHDVTGSRQHRLSGGGGLLRRRRSRHGVEGSRRLWRHRLCGRRSICDGRGIVFGRRCSHAVRWQSRNGCGVLLSSSGLGYRCCSKCGLVRGRCICSGWLGRCRSQLHGLCLNRRRHLGCRLVHLHIRSAPFT
jgi:hypothetical protein